MMQLRSKRRGFFDIQYELFEDSEPTVLAILNGCIITRAELMMHKMAIEYCAVHPDFDLVEQGTKPPWYKPIIGINADGSKTVRWQRRAE